MSKKWNKSSRGKTVVSTFPWWISSMLFSKNIPSLCYLVTISWWFRANSVGSCFDSSTWRKNRNPEKGTNFSQHLMENLWIQQSLLSIFKKNKHSINISPEITTSSPQKRTLITLRSNPLNLLTTPLLQFFPSAWELELAALAAFAWEKASI